MIKLVDEYIEEAEKKQVFLYIYSYFDSTLNQFNTPMVEDHDPDFMATSVRAGLIKGTFKPEQAAGLKFVYLGKFCIQTGEFDILPDGQVLVDCDRILKKEEKLD